MATRWSQENTRPQCPKCNLYGQGEQYIFGTKLNHEREGLADDVMRRARSGGTKHEIELLRARAGLLAVRNQRLVEAVDARYVRAHTKDHPTVAAIKTHRARKKG
jgi:hypothetical protein